MKWTLVANLAMFAPASASYVWPSTQDSMDDLLYLQSGYIRNGQLADRVQSCDFAARQPGIQKAAEWIRTAYHDAVTYDAETKTGGLDASIQYELNRSENLGQALNNTMGDISSSINVHNSAADVLSLALVIAVARCGDFYIPFRTGRIDATAAGISGVPQVHTDLQTTKRRFEIAGFNQSEMITLVACGHSVGSVHSVDHPEIVSGTPSPTNVAHFDRTFSALDNGVVTEYLDNSTANPLIRNANNMLNSDKRVFSSDGDETMKKLADGKYFKSQCEALLERMINLVPQEVKLTEPMVPADIRPYITSYQLMANGSLELVGRVRVRTSPVTGRDPASLTSSLIPISRDGTLGAEIPCELATFQLGQSFGYLREVFNWLEFSQTVQASQALKAFNIRVNGAVYNNANTGGYPLNPDILYQMHSSCLSYDSNLNKGDLTIVAAISKSLLGGNAAPQIRVIQKTTVQGNFIPRLQPEITPMARISKESGDYVFYQASTLLDPNGFYTTFDIEVGDSKVEFIETGSLISKVCEAI